VVPMLVLEVPFGKWSHMVYRPLAVYFAQLRCDALAREAATGHRSAATPDACEKNAA